MDNQTNKMNERESIANLQSYLRKLSYHDSDIRPVPIDGIFGSTTAQALTDFQRKYELEPTGRADRKTFELLRDISEGTDRKHAPPEMIKIFPAQPDSYILEIDSPLKLAVILHILSELEREYPFRLSDENNIPDNIALFQRANGLNESSQIDRDTWNELATQYNRLYDYSE